MLTPLVRECDALAALGHFSEVHGTPYIDPPDLKQPEGHPRRTLGRTALRAVAYDRFPASSALRALYEWDPLMEFLRVLLGRERLAPPRLEDPRREAALRRAAGVRHEARHGQLGAPEARALRARARSGLMAGRPAAPGKRRVLAARSEAEPSGVMAASAARSEAEPSGVMGLQLGEAFVGTGAEAAHVNTALGPREGPLGGAWATALATPSSGHAPFVVVVRPGLPAKPFTLFVNKAAIAASATPASPGARRRRASRAACSTPWPPAPSRPARWTGCS